MPLQRGPRRWLGGYGFVHVLGLDNIYCVEDALPADFGAARTLTWWRGEQDRRFALHALPLSRGRKLRTWLASSVQERFHIAFGELPLEVQRKPPAVLQSGRIRHLDSTCSRTLDVRGVAPTNCGSVTEVAAGHFREDLYRGVGALDVHMPPLRRRRKNIPLIFNGIAGISGEAWAASRAKVVGWGRAWIKARYSARVPAKEPTEAIVAAPAEEVGRALGLAKQSCCHRCDADGCTPSSDVPHVCEVDSK